MAIETVTALACASSPLWAIQLRTCTLPTYHEQAIIICMLHTSLYLFSNFDTRKNDVDGRIGSISIGYSALYDTSF